ncbi:Myosin-4 [Toxocara canis]|uniref:Myosin-4 n=1 Tax=Toxocara canis TaxID=6265 RepID=A0A0B2VPW3_TOXCA|nr:Myosin-4 [Toxocara canis]
MALEYESDPGWQYLRRSREQIAADQSAPYDSKKDVWIPDKEEGYIAAQIVSTKGDEVVVKVNGTEKTLKKELCAQMNPPKFEKTEDMSNLTFLNDASVLHNLRARYAVMLIYTYSGLFCVVINPYKRLPIYTDSVAQMFMGKRRSEMPPHLFAVSDEAYRNMLQNHENQSMLITGESGAGKTENTKKVIAYFASVGASQQGQTANAPDGKKKVTLEDQIVQTNPVLEAFGNARTVRNNNSSRFGKFIRIHFSKHGKVASCDIEHYLLEKSRVIRQAPGERCYHIFYQMTSDYKPELKPALLLDRPLRDYWFVAQAELTVDGMNDAEEFQLTDEAFDILHFSPEEKMNCYKLMSAHMHIGNMKFKQRPREEQAEPDGTDEAEKAAQMYGVDTEELLKAFTHPRVKVGTEWVNKGQNVEQVNWAVGAMGKAIYARVFNWLVKKCNITLDQKGIRRDYFIGVLDIAGFEIFDFNSFEQLWINFVNEKLQQFFNHHMFVLEQEEYAKEGIQWKFIDFGLDLQACIELIEKPMGIISMLDEECIVPKATDMTLAQKLNEQHLGKHPNFEKPKPPKGKQSEAHFAMRHYAGLVRYNVMNWLEKNKDPLNDTVAACLKASKGNALLNEIWADYTTQEEASHAAKSGGHRKGKSGSFMTVSMLYRESLNNLMSMLYKTHPHFIRCIIPNEKKKSGLLDAALVLNQLTCNGVLEGIRICRKGFPNRSPHPDFVERYALLCAEESKSSNDPKECAGKMLDKLVKDGSMKEEMFKIGLTKVFFKAGVLAHLEDLRDARLAELIAGLQARIRYYCQQIDLKERREILAATKVIQYNVADWAHVMNWPWLLLFIDTMPIVRASKMEEIMEQLRTDIGSFEGKLNEKNRERKNLEEELEKVLAEKNAIMEEIKNSRSGNTEVEDQIDRLNVQKVELETEIDNKLEKLKMEQQRTADESQAVKKIEELMETIKRNVQDVELGKRKSEAEKAAKENQIRSLTEEVAQQEEMITKLNKERKAQDENAKKLAEDIKAQEEKNELANKTKTKLEKSVSELEDEVDKEKRVRSENEKERRKVEGDLRVGQEMLEELNKEKKDLEMRARKKESEFRSLDMQLEQQQTLVSRLTKQVKDNEAKIAAFEEETDAEHEARAKSERARAVAHRELTELNDRLDEQRSATAAQIEIGKRHEAEIAKLKHELEETKLKQQSMLAAMRKKNSDNIAELNDQIAELRKQKMNSEKERNNLQNQVEEAMGRVDTATKLRVEIERKKKELETTLNDLQQKCDEQMRQIQESTTLKNRTITDNSELTHRIEELQEDISVLTTTKAQIAQQLEEMKRAVVDETGKKQSLNTTVRGLQVEIEQLRVTLEEEISGKDELNRQLNRANTEASQLKAQFEDANYVESKILEDEKKKYAIAISELEEALDAANSKLLTLEKAKDRLSTDVDDAQVEAEKHIATIAQLEKKQKAFQQLVDDWKKKVDDASNELDAAQKECRICAADVFKEQALNDNLNIQVEGLRHENGNLVDEIRDLQSQLGEGGKNVHEMRKMMRRLEVEKEELHRAIDETEAMLESEESKVTRFHVEIDQIRKTIEKRIEEKEEEFENIRKNHQRSLDSIQAALENEQKEKGELQRMKKKLEMDVNSLENALMHANMANEDAQRNIAKYSEQVGELQQVLEEERTQREQFKDDFANAEKRLAITQSEKEELAAKALQAERLKKQMESEVNEARSQVEQLSIQSNDLSAVNKKIQEEMLQAREETATLNLQKYRRLHAQLQTAEERVEAAQNGLQKFRSKTKTENANKRNSFTREQ